MTPVQKIYPFTLKSLHSCWDLNLTSLTHCYLLQLACCPQLLYSFVFLSFLSMEVCRKSKLQASRRIGSMDSSTRHHEPGNAIQQLVTFHFTSSSRRGGGLPQVRYRGCTCGLLEQICEFEPYQCQFVCVLMLGKILNLACLFNPRDIHVWVAVMGISQLNCPIGCACRPVAAQMKVSNSDDYLMTAIITAKAHGNCNSDKVL